MDLFGHVASVYVCAHKVNHSTFIHKSRVDGQVFISLFLFLYGFGHDVCREFARCKSKCVSVKFCARNKNAYYVRMECALIAHGQCAAKRNCSHFEFNFPTKKKLTALQLMYTM